MFFTYLAAQRSQIMLFCTMYSAAGENFAKYKEESIYIYVHRCIINYPKYIFISDLRYNSLLCVYVFRIFGRAAKPNRLFCTIYSAAGENFEKYKGKSYFFIDFLSILVAFGDQNFTSEKNYTPPAGGVSFQNTPQYPPNTPPEVHYTPHLGGGIIDIPPRMGGI